jgi:phosphonate transport system permease protein
MELKQESLSMTGTKTTKQFFQRQRLILTITILGMGLLISGASTLTSFNFTDAIAAIPRVTVWIFANLVPDGKAFTRLPRIIDKLLDTIFMSVMASMTAAFLSLLFSLLGSRTTSPGKFFAVLSRGIASINRNIPVAAWAMIFLLTFGQSSFTGFLALFFATFGFLTRAFMETIDEASSHPVQALRAAGANDLQVITQAVIPSCMPQMLSWVLYMIETNIRSATLVGLLTGSGIGFMFSIYYKSLQYGSASLVVLSIVVIVLAIELISNTLRRVIL